MPSPFPGMDPYLEHPEFFPGLHESLSVYFREALQPQLPDGYYSDIGTRVWIEESGRTIEPDVNVLTWEGPQATAGDGGGVATEVAAEPVIIPAISDEMLESFVEVYSLRGGRRLEPAVEFQSLSNKTGGMDGRELYRRKQRELLHSEVHLLEVDLLRGGEHTTAVPLARARRLAGAFDYHVCLHRFSDPVNFHVYPIRMTQCLPRIAVPLLAGDADVLVDLQAVFDRAYDTGPYRRLSPYRAVTPVPPLTPAQAAWSDQLLHTHGLLPTP